MAVIKAKRKSSKKRRPNKIISKILKLTIAGVLCLFIRFCGLLKYPLFNPEPGPFFFTALAAGGLALLAFVWFNRKFVARGKKTIFAKWLVLILLAAFPAMATYGALLIVNGLFDHSQPIEVLTTVVLKLHKHNEVKLLSTERPDVHTSLDLPSNEFGRLHIGDSVQLQVKPGTLGEPWIEKYTLLHTMQHSLQ